MTDSPSVSCSSCGTTARFEDGLLGWMASVKESTQTEIFCSECAPQGDALTPMAGSKVLREGIPNAPISGVFQPIRSGLDLESFVETIPFGSRWAELELALTLEIQALQEPPTLISFPTHYWPGLEFRIDWRPNQVAHISCPTHDSARENVFNIYQNERMKRMGFKLEYELSRASITLSAEESRHANLARVITHTLLFGYFLEIQWVTEVVVS